MKIRNGFVSNSSSSSFILIGIHVAPTDLSEELKDQIYEDDDIRLLEEDYEGRILLGDLNDIDEGDSGMIDFTDSQSALINIQKYFPEITIEDIKIFYGTRSC